MYAEDPAKLQVQIQHEANVVTEWFSRNDMVCSSDKTKLLIIGTHSNRHHKLEIQNLTLKVNVCGEEKTESNSEKLLGVIVNKYATFKNHFYGDEENQGLVKQLSSRVGVLKRLKKYLPPHRLKMVMEGMFSSKMRYGMTVWGRVWQIPGSLDEDQATRNSASMTKEDARRLQVLQNKCLRLLTNSDYKTPTKELLEKTNTLSVHQEIAHLSLSQVYNIHKTKLPAYHYRRLFESRENETRIRPGHVNRIEFDRSLARANFFYQSSRLWTALPDQVKSSENKHSFKKKCKTWIKNNILVKP